MPKIDVKRLPKAQLKGRKIPFEYTSDSHYKVQLKKDANGLAICLVKTRFVKPFRKREVEHLLTKYKGRSIVYGAFIGGVEAGLVQVEMQAWNNSLRIWDIAVWPRFQSNGVGAALMGKCKELARELGARRIVLETQTSNSKAVTFYLRQGFELVGMDTTNYRNDDVERCEVRLELAYHLKPKGKKRGRAP